MQITKPVISKHSNGYNFGWLEGQQEWLTIDISHIRRGFNDTRTAALTAYILLGERNLIENVRINLESLRDRIELALRLNSLYDLVDLSVYQACIEQVCVHTLRLSDTVEASVSLCDIEVPDTPKFRLEPILLEGEANMIFGDGGVGKTTIACALAVSIQDNVALPNMLPLPGKVLYIDYEQRGFDIKEQCQMLRRGMGLDGTIAADDDIRYMYLYQRLVDVIDQVQEEVVKHNINMAVIDSVGMACGGEGDKVEAVVPYFQALRSLGITTLSIDHLSKTSDGKTPTGSVYKRNIPRNVFLLKSEQSAGEGILNLAVQHTKGNRGLVSPMGLQLSFINGNDDHVVDEIVVDTLDLSNTETLSGSLTLTTRIDNYLKREGAMSRKDLAEELETTVRSIQVTMQRHKDRYVQLENNTWGLVVNE